MTFRSCSGFCPRTCPEGEVYLIHNSVHPTVMVAPMAKSVVAHSAIGWRAVAAAATAAGIL